MSASTVDPELLLDLTSERKGPCVSIYVETPGGRDIHQGPLRLAQLLVRAETELAEARVPPGEVAELLAPARALLDEPSAWKRGDGTLALYAAPGFFRQLHARLAATEESVVGRRFHVRPLLPLLASPARFYVLALSLNQVRLVEATAEGVRRLPLGELGEGFTAAMGYDEFYSELQMHSAGASGGGAARRPAIVHGHGDSDEEKLEEDLRHWFRRIAETIGARALDPHALRVLAATGERAALYLATSRDPLLLTDTLAGSPDRLSDAELAVKALPLVEAALAERRQEALVRWREMLGSERATGDLATVLRLAPQGRVQALFLPAAAELWGTYEATTGALELHVERRHGDEELLERAALETLGCGGDVYEVTETATLDGAPLAALLRG